MRTAATFCGSFRHLPHTPSTVSCSQMGQCIVAKYCSIVPYVCVCVCVCVCVWGGGGGTCDNGRGGYGPMWGGVWVWYVANLQFVWWFLRNVSWCSEHPWQFCVPVHTHTKQVTCSCIPPSLVSCPHAPPGKKWSGEQSWISWAYVAGFGFANGLFQLLTNTMSIGNIQIILTNWPSQYRLL